MSYFRSPLVSPPDQASTCLACECVCDTCTCIVNLFATPVNLFAPPMNIFATPVNKMRHHVFPHEFLAFAAPIRKSVVLTAVSISSLAGSIVFYCSVHEHIRQWCSLALDSTSPGRASLRFVVWDRLRCRIALVWRCSTNCTNSSVVQIFLSSSRLGYARTLCPPVRCPLDLCWPPPCPAKQIDARLLAHHLAFVLGGAFDGDAA